MAETDAPSDPEERTRRYARFVVERYASVRSVDAFGKEVPTVVWLAPYAGRLLLWVAASSPLIRRIQGHAHVTVAPCDEAARLLADPATATARVMFPEEFPTVTVALRAKYGWRFSVLRAAGAVGRLLFIRPKGYVGVELTLW